MDDLVKQLAKERDDVAGWKQRIADIKKKINASLDGKMLVAYYDRLDAAQEAGAEAGVRVRAAAMDAYGATGNKNPHAAVQIGDYLTLDYDPIVALDYARKHLPTAVSLIKKQFEDIAKVAKLDFVTISQEPRVKIKQNLSAYLDGDDDD